MLAGTQAYNRVYACRAVKKLALVWTGQELVDTVWEPCFIATIETLVEVIERRHGIPASPACS